MSFEELIDWLFEGTEKRPQLGFAGRDKRAWCWLPGKKNAIPETVSRAMDNAPLKGCSQVAYEDWWKPMDGQRCDIHWVGLDIDADDNPDGIDLKAIYLTKPSMIRTSVSGKGYHVIYRLNQPVSCTHETANKVIKAITAPLVAALPTIHVCKADKRMFWLAGGENSRMYQSENRISPSVTVETMAAATPPQVIEFEVTHAIKNWLDRLGIVSIRKSIPIYVGDMVKLLRSFGEKVETKSSCRGNGQLNGYIDLTPVSISLYAYADGHTIWNFTDVEALLDADKD